MTRIAKESEAKERRSNRLRNTDEVKQLNGEGNRKVKGRRQPVQRRDPDGGSLSWGALRHRAADRRSARQASVPATWFGERPHWWDKPLDPLDGVPPWDGTEVAGTRFLQLCEDATSSTNQQQSPHLESASRPPVYQDNSN